MVRISSDGLLARLPAALQESRGSAYVSMKQVGESVVFRPGPGLSCERLSSSDQAPREEERNLKARARRFWCASLLQKATSFQLPFLGKFRLRMAILAAIS